MTMLQQAMKHRLFFVRFGLMLLVASLAYYAVTYALFLLSQHFSFVKDFADLPLNEAGQLSRKMVLQPLLAIGALGVSFLIELWLGGWEVSSIKILSGFSPSARTDLFYLLLRISGLTAILAIICTAGVFNFLAIWMKDFIVFHVLDKITFWPLQIPLILLINSFVFYWFHRMMHTKYLWEIHKVHHSAEEFNILLTFRNHPIDFAMSKLVGVAVGMMLGGNPKALLCWAVLNSVYQQLVHSNAQWPRWMDRILITPASHRVHHSSVEKHWDKNFGILTCWDKWFGTYYTPDAVEKLGVEDAENFNNHRYFGELVDVMVRWLRGLRSQHIRAE